nr:iron hydrogenase small subunit [Sporomusa sphaeroides]
MRAQGIYKDDAKAKIRQSHNNQAVTDVYKKFAQNPLSHLAEELFHTKYVDRTKLV